MANAASVASTTQKPGDGYVQSFARGLEVIRSFSATSPAQTLTQVAESSGLSRAGARRILLTLQSLGYVNTDGKLFTLSPRILDLGFAYLSSMPMWNLAEPVMESLVAEVRESCSIAVLEDNDIIYVMRVPTHKIMSISLPAYCTSLGRVLLAALPDVVLIDRLLAADRRARTKHTLTDARELASRIAQVRKQGWSLVNQELEEGLVSMSAPITNPSGQVVAALNISGQANRTSAKVMQETMLVPLLTAAQTISRSLGAQRA
jgi:IclR family pca regulon transcriptional regulator